MAHGVYTKSSILGYHGSVCMCIMQLLQWLSASFQPSSYMLLGFMMVIAKYIDCSINTQHYVTMVMFDM